MALSFNVGDLFYSFAELETKLNDYKSVNFVEFWKQDARAILNAKKRLKKELKPELRYYEIKYCCIYTPRAVLLGYRKGDYINLVRVIVTSDDDNDFYTQYI